MDLKRRSLKLSVTKRLAEKQKLTSIKLWVCFEFTKCESNQMQTIKNNRFSQVLCNKLWLTFETFFKKINTSKE